MNKELEMDLEDLKIKKYEAYIKKLKQEKKKKINRENLKKKIEFNKILTYFSENSSKKVIDVFDKKNYPTFVGFLFIESEKEIINKLNDIGKKELEKYYKEKEREKEEKKKKKLKLLKELEEEKNVGEKQ